MHVGLGVDDLPEIYRAEYLHAIELTRASHDTATDWDGFVEALWGALVPAFGLDAARAEVGELADPAGTESEVTPLS